MNDLPTHAHGGNIIRIAAARDCRPADLVDMSSNLSPFGPPRELLDHLCEHIGEIGYLPEPDSLSLRQRFARRYGLAATEVLAGSGTTEFIFSLPRACDVRRAVIPQPTYGDYFLACQRAALPVDEIPAGPEFTPPLEELGRHLGGEELVFFCNPNNPTGKLVPTPELRDWIADHPQTLFVIDESYLPFCSQPSLVAGPRPDNCLVLCSYSKIFAIAGLRLGFLVGPASLLARLHRFDRPWGVNRLAQRAGEFLLEHGDAYRQQVLDFLAAERPRLLAALHALPGITVIDGATHYILCRLETETGLRASELAKRCLDAGIIVRDCANFTGLDDRYFRISLKTREANDRFVGVLRDILADHRGRR